MKSCRRAWNVVKRDVNGTAQAALVPDTNPFSKMGLLEAIFAKLNTLSAGGGGLYLQVTSRGSRSSRPRF